MSLSLALLQPSNQIHPCKVDSWQIGRSLDFPRKVNFTVWDMISRWVVYALFLLVACRFLYWPTIPFLKKQTYITLLLSQTKTIKYSLYLIKIKIFLKIILLWILVSLLKFMSLFLLSGCLSMVPSSIPWNLKLHCNF